MPCSCRTPLQAKGHQKAIQKPLESHPEGRQDSHRAAALRARSFLFSRKINFRAPKIARSRLHPRAGSDVAFFRVLVPGSPGLCFGWSSSQSDRWRAERTERAGHDNRLLGDSFCGPFRTGSVRDRVCFLSFDGLASAVDCAGGVGSSLEVRSKKLKTGRGDERGSMVDRDRSYLPPVPVRSVAPWAEL